MNFLDRKSARNCFMYLGTLTIACTFNTKFQWDNDYPVDLGILYLDYYEVSYSKHMF